MINSGIRGSICCLLYKDDIAIPISNGQVCIWYDDAINMYAIHRFTYFRNSVFALIRVPGAYLILKL